MNTNQTNMITRRQALIAIAAGSACLASATVLAKLPSDTSKIKGAGVIQSENISNHANRPFVMYF